MDRIGLDGMVFYGHHGVHEEEKRLGQRFVVDLTVGVDAARAGASDDLTDTVNYSDLYRTVRDVLEGPSRNLLESVAEETARRILEGFAAVVEVRVRVRKPNVPIKGALDGAWVEVTRNRAAVGEKG